MIREDCKELNMTLQEAAHMTRDRKVWRATIDERLTRATESPGALGHVHVVTRPYRYKGASQTAIKWGKP